MNDLPPVPTVHLFPDLLEELLTLLESLAPGDWERPVPRKTWSARDVALHLLGVDVGVLSSGRDGFAASIVRAGSTDELVRELSAFNDAWVLAARRISPRLLCELLRVTGGQVIEYFKTLEPGAPGAVVSWAGPNPAPHWLGIGREYTERWHHQQHIREAVGREGVVAPGYLHPVLEILVRALPKTYRNVDAAVGTTVGVTISGDAGGRWRLSRQPDAWHLQPDSGVRPTPGPSFPRRPRGNCSRGGCPRMKRPRTFRSAGIARWRCAFSTRRR